VRTIQRELVRDGLVLRYSLPTAAPAGDGRVAAAAGPVVDGLAGAEGAFLACSFWLVNALHMIGDYEAAVRLFERLLSLRSDVGLLSEEYDPRYDRQVGNTPQAFSHMPLILSALNLAGHAGQHCRRPAGRAEHAQPG
jgi:GH15 family glucan-1,4-alpha-glucosidase